MDIYKDITLILVTYRSEKLILKNLEILKKFPVIIVDNSNSNELGLIVHKYNNIKLIKSSKNLGYGKANNLAIKSAVTSFILIVNPDIILDEVSINNLLKSFLKDPDKIGILGPSLFDEDMNRRTNGSKSYLNQLKGHKVFNKSNNIPLGETCCEFLMGCCYLMKRDFFNILGGFDKNFFMYYEDSDLCDRCLQEGRYLMEVPSAKLIHLENSSSKKNFFTNTKLSLIHKISSYIYLKKNTSFRYLTLHMIKNFIEYFQRFFVNLLILRFKKSFKNLLRIISLLLYITSLYKILYNFWRV